MIGSQPDWHFFWVSTRMDSFHDIPAFVDNTVLESRFFLLARMSEIAVGMPSYFCS